MKINEMVNKVHTQAKKSGWWEGGARPPLELLMLMVTELAEAAEEFRKPNLESIYWESDKGIMQDSDTSHAANLRQGEKLLKPEGALIELADTVIRIADYCGFMGWDLERAIKMKMEYNATREYRHGGKLS